MTNEELWRAALGELELQLSRANFTTWFRNTFIATRAGGRVVVGVPHSFAKTWLETKYHPAILKTLQHLTASEVAEIAYEIAPNRVRVVAPAAVALAPGAVASPPKDTDSVQSPADVRTGLKTHYTFTTFVTGKGNELARAASLAVAERPGLAYNPLFIYGASGLGKTHLLHAVGNAALERDAARVVRYVTCDQFVSDFVNAVKRGRSDAFKSLYRAVDVLLMDDVAFLSGREGTQEEFFHTFNALYDAKKQIVVTCDRPPKSIPGLEERLVTRFGWGMIADIGSPDLETRQAILEAKARERGVALEPAIVQLVATSVHSNVRELEGALNRLIAYQELRGRPATLEDAQTILASLSGRQKQSGVTPKLLVATVASFYDISIEDVAGNSRRKELVLPRQIAMYLLREELRSSYPAIGHELGDRDHTTAMHACEKISRELERDVKLKQDLDQIRQRLYVR